MASIQSFSGFGSSYGMGHKRIGKPKTKVVKPILKKLQSHSEKNSLDLDRGWDEQDERFGNYSAVGGATTPTGSTFYDTAGVGRPLKDVSSLDASGITSSSSGISIGIGPGAMSSGGGARRYHHHHHHGQHARSISGTSHASVATSNSGGNGNPHRVGGAFVHPFQQIPGSSTPPLYTNSAASLTVDSRDYSPTITEDDDDDAADYMDEQRDSLNMQRPLNPNPNLNLNQNPTPPKSFYSPSQSQPILGLHRPSLASHRTSSYSGGDGNSSHPSLKINTSRSFLKSATSAPAPAAITTTNVSATSGPTSHPTSHPISAKSSTTRFANASSTTTRSDIHIDQAAVDSPLISPSDSIAPMSPLRSSFDFDGGFPRLRAKSDLDTATRAEHLRAARRKFELKEKAKEEKYAREEIKRRERADNKRAQEAERQAAAALREEKAARARQDAAELHEAMLLRKQQQQRQAHHHHHHHHHGHGYHHRRKVSGTSSGRPSLSTIARPSMSGTRPSTSHNRNNGGGGGASPTPLEDIEKFVSSNYDSLDARSPPAFGDEAGTASAGASTGSGGRRGNAAKKKTHSAWHMFVLWLRTKLLRVGKNH